MKILNLYAGIGGNRKLWGDKHEITAVEIDPEIAKIYQDFFPNDKVIVADAHQFLLEHYKEFDFIWSSPPCPTHSRVRKVTEHQNAPVFPDMKLYEEILFLMGYFKGKWVVENVISWYEPLIKPYQFKQHYYWANFVIDGKKNAFRNHDGVNQELQEIKGFDLSKYSGIDKTKILRNCVEPEAGLEIFNLAFKNKQVELFAIHDLGEQHD
jgi:DNA (cytosine-5)-methyltransferase 1